MRDDEQRRARGGDEIEHEAQRLVARVLVEIAGGLVGEDQPWPRRQRPPDRDTLLLAAGERFRIAPLEPRKTEPCGQLRLPGGIEPPAEPRLKAQILRDREARDEVESLEDEPDGLAPQLRALGLGKRAERLAAKPDFARVRRIEPRREIEQRAFAASRLSHERQRLARREGEVDAFQDLQPPLRRGVGFHDPARLEEGGGGIPQDGCLIHGARRWPRREAEVTTSNWAYARGLASLGLASPPSKAAKP